MSDTVGRPPRWDQDDRGLGVGDARGYLDVLDALRRAADETGWVAEDPRSHLLPHLVRHVAEGSSWVIDATEVGPDGAFEVDARWIGPADADRRTLRAAAHALIGAVAEATTAIHERHGPDGVAFDVVTGMLPGQTGFAPHGHTLRLRVSRPIDPDDSTGADG